jgi:hypothetical protein
MLLGSDLKYELGGLSPLVVSEHVEVPWIGGVEHPGWSKMGNLP